MREIPTLVREHLLERLTGQAGPLALLVAPAGFGKTTVLTQYAERFPGPVVRWRPHRGTGDAGALLSALARRLPGAPEQPTLEACLLAVERLAGPVLLLVDDLHLARGTAAEAAVEEIALLAPPGLRVVAAGRRLPSFNLTRRELAGTTVLLPRDLRLGLPEVELLVGDAETAPAATELTGGWPAALHLLRPALVRESAAAPPAGAARAVGPLTGSYIEREVFGALPERLAAFLRQVCPLPVLDAERCDRLTGGRDSAWLLDELATEYALVESERTVGTYRWLPLLREHLLRRWDGTEPVDHDGPYDRHRPVGQDGPVDPVGPGGRSARARTAAGPGVSVRCFGGFELTLDGRSPDWSRVRPRARALLRVLAVHAGRPVHRELLMEALWPDRPAATAARALQVAVSALRTFLEPGVARGGARLLVRSGEAYLLRIAVPADCDLLRFETALAEGWRARGAGRTGPAARALRAALEAYTGELLPEDGPAEWVVERREHYRREAAEAALALAKLELAGGRPLAAARAASRSLTIDAFRDDAWHTLIAAQQRYGDAAAAQRSRAGYARMLHSLGLPAVRLPARDGDRTDGRPPGGAGEVTAV
ncbi:BTAD domain-containing putative transcriptional regulator [Kitasatospora paracochleata]|uniref:DNA-binding SARP family transcriptional activator n=1 Tax=Kitasatospora paracochleata TaxID=58354 RepID=A0ABT1IVJ2_9ACTN|nr:BTAD domain-containing putative transcriptional regulator [Kitasatospora paracochleata]MCP2309159.1 DNA-binding SARP family transcriptional activator [Kitasatospora paracochleata]